MHLFFVGQLGTSTLGSAASSLGLGVTSLPPNELARALVERAPALVLLAQDAGAIQSLVEEIASAGRRFETFIIALVESSAEVDAALDAGADDVFLASSGSEALAARINVASHHLTVRLGFAPRLGACVEVTDHLGRLQYASPAFEELSGYRIDDVRGQDAAALLGRDDPSYKAYRAAWARAAEDGFWSGTLPVRGRSGRRLHHELALSGVRRRRGEIAYVIGQRRDVTESAVTEEQVRLLEAELRRAEHMATIGTLAAGVAHEINNPLTYVISNVSFVLTSLKVNDLAQEVEALTDAMEGCDRVNESSQI